MWTRAPTLPMVLLECSLLVLMVLVLLVLAGVSVGGIGDVCVVGV